MADKDYVTELYGATNPDGISERAYGWWMGDGPTLVWANLIWCFVIGAWTAFWMVHTLLLHAVVSNGIRQHHKEAF